MNEPYTVTTREGLGSRFGNSLKGALIGLLLFIAAFPVLWKNEGRSVQRARELKEGRGLVVQASANQLDANNEGALVHVTGHAETPDTLTDAAFGVSIQAIKLIRDVEMFQYVEKEHTDKKKNLGGSETTTKSYTYDKQWRDSVIDSSRFVAPDAPTNPNSMPFRGESIVADTVQLGEYLLSDRLVGAINDGEQLPVTQGMFDAMPANVRAQATPHNSGVYIGDNPASAAIGDLRIRFDQVPDQDVSVIAKQAGNLLTRYDLSKGNIEMLRGGILTPDEMFTQAEKENQILTWIFRGLGFLLMGIGLASIFGPLAVATDIIPLLGRLSRAGITLLAGIVAFSLSVVTIAVAWLAYRPLLGGGLLVLALLALVGLKSLSGEKYQAPPPPPPPPPPPA